MSFGQIVLGILLFAVATAVLYVWGLKKSMTQEADLERILLNKCAGTVVKLPPEARKHHPVMPSLIQGSGTDIPGPKPYPCTGVSRLCPKLIRYMLEQQLLEDTGGLRYRLKG